MSGCNSVARVSAFQAVRRGFESHHPLQYVISEAGWSSPVARQAHNLKVVGSNPTPASIFVLLVSSSVGRAGDC